MPTLAAATKADGVLWPFHSAIFAGLLARESATDIAQRLNVPPESVFAAMRTEALRACIDEFEADEARRDMALSRSALRTVIQESDDPIERRRAATSLLRFFRSPVPPGTTAWGRSRCSSAPLTTRPTASSSSRSSPPRGQCASRSARSARHSAPDDPDPADELDDSEDDKDEKPPPPPHPIVLTPETSIAIHTVVSESLAVFRRGFPMELALSAFHPFIHDGWARNHGSCAQFAHNSNSPKCFLWPVMTHTQVEIGDPRPDPIRKGCAVVPVNILEPVPRRMLATVGPDSARPWTIRGFADAPDTS